MYYIYVIQSLKDKNLYTGYTTNIQKRILEHNQGKVFATKTKIPFKLLYFEGCLNMKDARAREKYLKSGMGKRYIKNRIKFFFEC